MIYRSTTKKKLLLIVLSIFFVSFVSATTTYSIATENGHAYKIMKVVLDGKSAFVVSVVENAKSAQSLKSLMNAVSGTNAINGAYFCPKEAAYSRCEGNTTDGLRISNGTLYSKRGKDIAPNNSVFGFDVNGIPLVVSDKGTSTPDPALDKVYNGLMMPTLVKDGVNVAVVNTEMNTDPKQSAIGNKSFICSTQDNKNIYMGYVNNETFSSIADYIIKTFHCYNAIQLDNGASRSMIYNGQYVVGPGRNIMDAFVITSIVSQELKTAVAWMYSIGLTSKATFATYLPNDTMTREGASKFFSIFAKDEFNKIENPDLSCNFYDINNADPTLTSSIISSCKLGIFKGYQGNFSPKEKITNAQAITVLMRIMVGTLPEPSDAFYANYLVKAQELGLVGDIAVNDFITRGDAAILLYKVNTFHIAAK